MLTELLLAEMTVLQAAVAAHRVKLVEAQDARDIAIEAAGIPTKYGRYDLDFDKDAWRYPSVEAAIQVVKQLADDDGYFWACSRLHDLENVLGYTGAQLPLRTSDMYVPLFSGNIPEAHPSVADFLCPAV